MIPLVDLDTNIFFAAFETAGARSDHAWWVIKGAEDGHIVVATSELTLAELLSKPPLDDPDLIASYEGMIESRPGLQVLPVDRPVLLQAAAIRREVPSVKLPDAIHLAKATLSGCAAFLTGDLKLESYRSLEIIRFSPHSLDEIHEGRGA